jgi:hypothetical protein
MGAVTRLKAWPKSGRRQADQDPEPAAPVADGPVAPVVTDDAEPGKKKGKKK